MADAHDVILDQRNWLERLVQLVPGFAGYYGRENRREADRVLREFGAARLEQIVLRLHEAVKASPLEAIEPLRELIRTVEKLRNELRFADQGYAGFFSEIKWDSDEVLHAIYQVDGQIVERVVALAEAADADDAQVADLRRDARVLERALNERKHAILGLVGAGLPGESGERT